MLTTHRDTKGLEAAVKAAKEAHHPNLTADRIRAVIARVAAEVSQA